MGTILLIILVLLLLGAVPTYPYSRNWGYGPAGGLGLLLVILLILLLFTPWLDRLCNACRYTMPANETGLPAISIPAGLDSGGLPIGVQLYGNFCGEDLLLQMAAQIERARPEWFGAIPPVHVTKAD